MHEKKCSSKKDQPGPVHQIPPGITPLKDIEKVNARKTPKVKNCYRHNCFIVCFCHRLPKLVQFATDRLLDQAQDGSILCMLICPGNTSQNNWAKIIWSTGSARFVGRKRTRFLEVTRKFSWSSIWELNTSWLRTTWMWRISRKEMWKLFQSLLILRLRMMGTTTMTKNTHLLGKRKYYLVVKFEINQICTCLVFVLRKESLKAKLIKLRMRFTTRGMNHIRKRGMLDPDLYQSDSNWQRTWVIVATKQKQRTRWSCSWIFIVKSFFLFQADFTESDCSPVIRKKQRSRRSDTGVMFNIHQFIVNTLLLRCRFRVPTVARWLLTWRFFTVIFWVNISGRKMWHESVCISTNVWCLRPDCETGIRQILTRTGGRCSLCPGKKFVWTGELDWKILLHFSRTHKICDGLQFSDNLPNEVRK